MRLRNTYLQISKCHVNNELHRGGGLKCAGRDRKTLGEFMEDEMKLLGLPAGAMWRDMKQKWVEGKNVFKTNYDDDDDDDDDGDD